MKIVVIGIGQCGSRIADEFARINRKAISERGIEICPGAFAVNTDSTDLSGLRTIKSDFQHRILIGTNRTGGHGVGKMNDVGAEVAREDADKIVDALRSSKKFYETDAFLVAASTGGGTGSGGLAIITQHIKDRYADKPVYAMAVLPFEHEQENEERAIYNTAVCLKSVYTVADAVFLVDNQRYVKKGQSMQSNLDHINALIVEPFYDLLCAGEEKRAANVGSKTVDAGDIIQTLSGWSVIGHGSIKLDGGLRLSVGNDFRQKSTETHKGIRAMDTAVSELSSKISARDAGRAMFLISAPANEINVDLVKEIGGWIKEIAPNAVVRNGDYPTGKTLDVTLILSELADAEIVRNYYTRSASLVPVMKMRQEEVRAKLQAIDDAGKDIPTVL
ncbi:MAG: tubulin/FtsZ family protein [Dehalococcoidia bacterium]|nr:tubulin/FtsZ family protein [Dehalococcoidia bacterium]